MRPTPTGRVFACAAGAALLALSAGAVLATGQAVDPESQPIPEGSSTPTAITSSGTGSALRLIIGLVIVLGLIAAVWWILKRVQRGRFHQGETGGGVVSVIATTPIGPNRALHLIEVAGELVLVGATDHGITPIARVTSDPTRDVLDIGMPEMASPSTAATAVDPRQRAWTAPENRLVDRLRAMTAR